MDYDRLIERLKSFTVKVADEEWTPLVCLDAVVAVENLRAHLARVTAERDAAVQDLEEIMFKGGHNIDTCHFCTNGQCYGRGGTQCCEPKWRGIKKED